MFTDYGNGLLQITSSFRKYYQLKTYYNTDPVIDTWLDTHKFQHIFLILIDGMGSRILQKHADPDSYFLNHMKKEVETVYPPTTSAATTAIRTGLAPSQTGWIGWNQYFQECDDEIILFFGQSQYQDKNYGQQFAYEKLPVKFLYDELTEHGITSTSVWPAWSKVNPCEDYSDILERLSQIEKDPNTHFVYAYWDLLDTLMHQVGPSNHKVEQEIRRLDTLTKEFMQKKSENTGVLIIADHGQIDVENIDVYDDPQFCSYLKCLPSLETRTASLFIKDGKQEEFRHYFQEHYGKYFLLLSHDEVLEKQIFGKKPSALRFEEFIGDFVAFATDRYCFAYHGIGMDTKGQHAGTLVDEMMIPVILSD